MALSAEMLGGMSEAFDRTLAYLKERVQFGVLIGTFQALKHRAARLFIGIAMRRTRRLVRALERNPDDAVRKVAQRALETGDLTVPTPTDVA